MSGNSCGSFVNLSWFVASPLDADAAGSFATNDSPLDGEQHSKRLEAQRKKWISTLANNGVGQLVISTVDARLETFTDIETREA